MPRLPLTFAFALACCLALPAAPAQEPSSSPAPAPAPSSASETGPGAKPVPASRRQTGAQAVIGTGAGAAQNRQANDRDAKNRPTGAPKPAEDPALARYGIYADSAPEPGRTAPVVTTLPLKLAPGTRIAFIGNTLFDRSQEFPWFESRLHLAHPGHRLVIRHFAWPADEIDLQPRPDNFATVKQHLARERIDVIFAAFGYNESFAGVEAIDSFKARLTTWLIDLKTSACNGATGPRIVLVSPIANENVAGIPAADLNNGRLAAYTAAMAEVARREGVGFADVFATTRAAMDAAGGDLTINGAHLTDEGYRIFADHLFREVFGESPPADHAELRATLADQYRQFFRRYRPLNSFYYTGGRNRDYGYLDFLPAMRNFDLMTANREARAWEIAQGRSFAGQPVDDSNLPPLEAVAESRGANEWLTAAAEQQAFRVDPRVEVNLFAGEEQFPDLANPIQMRWDARGRLWVSCSTTYPHLYPGREPADKIVILEDSDRDGRADRSTVWADDLHIPLSFEFYRDGILVSEEPHLSWIRDTDGDGRADRRERLLAGFGCEDSHHALHDFVWTPDGELLFRESIFHNTQVETPYGPVRAKNSAWFQFRPATQRLITFGSYPNTNPWGVTFDDWGRHVASHPIFANAFHAPNPPYPEQHPAAKDIPAYSGVCGHEFVDFPMWPGEMRGGFVKVRYKPTNKVEFHRWIEGDDHFAEEFVCDLVFSENLSFIPVDVRFGPRGDLYVCDWYNPVKGHAQYSLRDPRRDRRSGRIWRIVPKGAALADPPAIDGAPLPALLDLLKRPEYRYRYWTKRELRDRHEPAAVAAALDAWVAALDPAAARHRHHQLEALWVYRSLGVSRPALLKSLLACENPHARAAATRLLRHAADPAKPGQADIGLPLAEAAALVRERAADESGLVRLEAAIAASHLGTREALEAMLPVLDRPMGAHLQYAVQTALGSAPLSRHWRGDAAFLAAHPKLDAFLKAAARPAKAIKGLDRITAADRAFDRQPAVKAVEVTCVPERLLFDVTRIEVSPGQPVKLTLINPDATQHNLVIVQPGALEEIGLAGNEMAKDPGGFARGFIPESPKILHHTKLLEPGTGEVLRFRAPEQPGVYPYLCTFPGHWVVMKGELVVR